MKERKLAYELGIGQKYDEMMEEYKVMRDQLLKEHPELRKKASVEFSSIRERIQGLKFEVDILTNEYFLDENRKICKIGYVGRAVNAIILSQILGNANYTIGKLIKSLEGGKVD